MSYERSVASNEMLADAFWKWHAQNEHALDLGGTGDLQALLAALNSTKHSEKSRPLGCTAPGRVDF